MNDPRAPYDWNQGIRLRRLDSLLPAFQATHVLDETLRDGLQCPSARHPSLREKLELLHAMPKLGINAVNLGIPAASTRAKDDAIRLVTEIERQRLPLVPVLAGRTLSADIRTILQVCDKTGAKVEAHTFIGSSTIRAYAEGWRLNELIERTRSAVNMASRAGLGVTFVTEDTTRSAPVVLTPLLLTALDAGASRLCIADTVGHADQDGVRTLVRYVKQLLSNRGSTDISLDFHGHNDRGLALANALTAAECGVDRIHATAMGVGERCGNTCMELLLANLRGEPWSRSAHKQLSSYVTIAATALRLRLPSPWLRTGRLSPNESAGTPISSSTHWSFSPT
jgi:2-isopropylmalate synthase